MTLSELRPGDAAVIRGFSSEAAPIRLLEMGLLPGERIQVVRLAPFGDPIDVKLRGYHLSIRKSEAAFILIDRTAT